LSQRGNRWTRNREKNRNNHKTRFVEKNTASNLSKDVAVSAPKTCPRRQATAIATTRTQNNTNSNNNYNNNNKKNNNSNNSNNNNNNNNLQLMQLGRPWPCLVRLCCLADHQT